MSTFFQHFYNILDLKQTNMIYFDIYVYVYMYIEGHKFINRIVLHHC